MKTTTSRYNIILMTSSSGIYFQVFVNKSDLFVRDITAETLDQYIQLTGSKKYSFYSVIDSRDQIVLEDSKKQFMSVFIRLDSTSESYSRQVYSFSDLLAQVGGIYQSIFFIGVLFVGIFSERLFISSILRKIYQLDKIREDQIKYCLLNENKQENQIDTENIEDQPSETVHLSKVLEDGIVDPQEAEQTKRALVKTVALVDKENKGSQLDLDRKERIFETIRFLLANRLLFKYTYSDIFQYIFH